MNQRQVDAFADDSLVPGHRGTDELRREYQRRVIGEFRREPVLRQLDAVSLDAREADLARIALRADGVDVNRFARRLRRSDHRLRVEVEGNAEDVRVFHVEEAVFIQIVRLTAKRRSDDLPAENL